ncbi:MAG: nuclease ue, partial [Actinomycetota bacterium]
MRRPPLLAVLILALAVVVARRVDSPAPPADHGGRVAAGPATVLAVLDGDTLVVRMAGYEGPLRVVGVDTPEIAHRGDPAACFGPEAAASTAGWLAGRSVVVRPAREQRDRQLPRQAAERQRAGQVPAGERTVDGLDRRQEAAVAVALLARGAHHDAPAREPGRGRRRGLGPEAGRRVAAVGDLR